MIKIHINMYFREILSSLAELILIIEISKHCYLTTDDRTTDGFDHRKKTIINASP